MPRFKDASGREWAVEITVATVKRVRSLVGVDLLDLGEGRLMHDLMADPVTLCDVLYAVCRPQALEAGVSDEDFGAVLAGDAIASATTALLEGLADFFPNPRQRDNLRAVVSRTNAVVDKAHAAAAAEIESGVIEKAAEAALERHGGPSTGSPASSASTPPP